MNTRFNNQPKLELMKEDSGGRAYFKLLEDFTLNINEVTITVPKFFTTDFASVPRILWSIFPPVGNYSSAALIICIHEKPIALASLQTLFLTVRCKLWKLVGGDEMLFILRSGSLAGSHLGADRSGIFGEFALRGR